MPAPKGPAILSNAPKSASKQEPSGDLKEFPQTEKKPGRPADRSPPRNRRGSG